MGRLALLGFCVIACLFLVGSGVAASTKGSGVPNAVVSQTAVVGQQVVNADIRPSTGNPPISQAQAEALAAKQVSGAADALHTSAQYVEITLRSSDGKVFSRVQAHPVWLVTFEGVGYTPSRGGEASCSCDNIYARSNTVVALDARTGALVTLYGTDDSTP